MVNDSPQQIEDEFIDVNRLKNEIDVLNITIQHLHEILKSQQKQIVDKDDKMNMMKQWIA